MDEKEAVITPAEPTVETESAPVENETADAPQESADTIVEQENKVSDSVPYSRFKEVNDRLRELESQVQPVAAEYEPAPEASENPFDETTTQGVSSLAERIAEQTWEKKEAAKWVKQNAGDLKDPIVDSRTKDLIRQGYDRENALTQAKKELSDRVSPVQKEALAQGVKEGQQLANSKSQMGAIGTAGSSSKSEPSELSASEFAKYYGIPRV